jgi:hypothetical protein
MMSVNLTEALHECQELDAMLLGKPGFGQASYHLRRIVQAILREDAAQREAALTPLPHGVSHG